MIQLTRLDGSPVIVNLETIKYMEPVPDTLIFFVNGDSMLVKEEVTAVEEKIVEFKARILAKSRE